MSQRVWVLAVNDGEAVEIVRLLSQYGEVFYASEQAWGATWAGLEEPIKDSLRRFCASCEDREILGIELGGANPYAAIDIDHHRYRDEDRSNPLSSLEQVAAKLGVSLDRRQRLVAANDHGFIAGMMELGASAEEIREIRGQDLEAQGVTADEIAAQHREVEAASVADGRYLVNSAYDPPTALSDILFLDMQAREWLIRSPHVWSYSGPRHLQMDMLNLAEPHWSGGRTESGYFGIAQPGSESQQRILAVFLA
jgi:hypothetical protein